MTHAPGLATPNEVKKTFPLSAGNHKPERVVESIKSDIRKYVKRERRKKLPEDVDFWDFDCRVGQEEASAKTAHVAELVAAVDTAAQENWTAIYIEILAKPGHRNQRVRRKTPEEDPATDTDHPADAA